MKTILANTEVKWAVSALESIDEAINSGAENVTLPGYGPIGLLSRQEQDAIVERMEVASRLLFDNAQRAFDAIHALRNDPEIAY